MNPLYDDTYHADQTICQNLTEITPSSVLGALRRDNRKRRVLDVIMLPSLSYRLASRCSHR